MGLIIKLRLAFQLQYWTTQGRPSGKITLPVESAVEVGWRMRPSVTSCYSLRHKVRLLPAGLPVDVPELLVLPHGEEHLAGELDHPAAVLGPLPGDVHQSVHPTSLQERPER